MIRKKIFIHDSNTYPYDFYIHPSYIKVVSGYRKNCVYVCLGTYIEEKYNKCPAGCLIQSYKEELFRIVDNNAGNYCYVPVRNSEKITSNKYWKIVLTQFLQENFKGQYKKTDIYKIINKFKKIIDYNNRENSFYSAGINYNNETYTSTKIEEILESLYPERIVKS
jgi:hypothetical protein